VLGTAWISRGGSAPRRWRAEIRKPQTSAAAALAGAAIEDCFSLAAKATGVSGLAERYAAALFELADERRMLDPVAADLRALQAMIGESADLVRLLRSPILSRAAQEKAIAALAERAGLSPLVRDFLRVAARNRRLFAVPAMIEAYLAKLAERRGEVTAEVTAAQPLSPTQLERLGEELRRALGRRVAVAVRVDRGLLGGLIVKVGSRMVDGSLRSKLARLQLAMKGPG
jgi:F-type H+-transporting ATPase subunit delta